MSLQIPQQNTSLNIVSCSASDVQDSDLLNYLRAAAILNSSTDRPLRGRNGNLVPWMFYSWPVSLCARGAALLAETILKRLRGFRGTQLASIGYTGLPLVTACVLLGNGRYTALAVRHEKKRYGSCRQVEGLGDKQKTVVLIDDSISSGTSLRAGIAALEEDGYSVEGAICVVRFPGRGGIERAVARGYHIEYLFDVWTDLKLQIPPYVPAHLRAEPTDWDDSAVPNRLHPTSVVRQVANHFFETRRVLRPPTLMDAHYSGPGGVYVSFRQRDDDKRVARDGFWHFDARYADACRDVVLATAKTLRSTRGLARPDLKDLKIAVTFLGELESITPSGLHFARYGIVVRSSLYQTKVGGALPNTQVFSSEIEQYNHARTHNARLAEFEPHDLWRYTISKYVEPGEDWLSYGCPEQPTSQQDDAIGAAVCRRAREVIDAQLNGQCVNGTPLSHALFSRPIYAVAVTIYCKGLYGCRVTWGAALDDCIVRAASGAITDKRLASSLVLIKNNGYSVCVSVLHTREILGCLTSSDAAKKLRVGYESIAVGSGRNRGLFLPNVGVHFCWGPSKLAASLLRKAKIQNRHANWATYITDSWIQDRGQIRRVRRGFTVRQTRIDRDWIKSTAASVAGYIARSIDPTGLPVYCRFPVQGCEQRLGTAGRVVHALGALHDAAVKFSDVSWASKAECGLRACREHLVACSDGRTLALPGRPRSAMADAQLLMCLSRVFRHERDEREDELATRVGAFLRPDGSIGARDGQRHCEDHDFLPGVALLAAVERARKRKSQDHLKYLSLHLAWYRRRFRNVHSWGMVGWHSQAWVASEESVEAQEFVFEMIDWAITRQLASTGAFLTDLDASGPSFHTAFVLEGVADAWLLAKRVGDLKRAAQYEASWYAGMRFMDSLIIGPQDVFCMRDGESACGGVRANLQTTAVRIDFVSHTLLAVLKGWQVLDTFV
jgi:orotate phosphoribosyltransferase/AMMECR1 domain-containing protein